MAMEFQAETASSRVPHGGGRRILNGVLGALGAAMLSFGDPAAAEPVEGEQPLAMRLEYDRPLVLKGDTTPVYAVIRLAAAEPERIAARPALNVALVLDRSGSMEDEGKIDYLRRAAGQLVDRLKPSDILSIVEYDDEITVMWPAHGVDSPFTVKRLIDGLSPRGSTDLAGGMVAGATEARRALDTALAPSGAVTRVLLMSDGLANQGVTEPEKIKALVKKAKAAGTPITTLGLGRDYDEDLMQMIAESGGGRYYYIENPNQMARIFALELDSLANTVAKDGVIEIKADGAEILGFSAQKATLGDLYGGENRAFLVRLPVDTQSIGVKKLGSLKLTYLDASTQKIHNFEELLGVEVTDDAAKVAAASNRGAAVEAALAETERGQSEAVKLFESGDKAGAEKRMNALAKAVEERQAVLKDVRLEKKLEALSVERDDMSAAALAPETSNAYLKRSKQRLYQAKQGNRALSVLQTGDSGYAVEQLQEALAKAGYYQGPVDGQYSASLEEAVKAYQQDQNLGADGVAGPATMKELGLY